MSSDRSRRYQEQRALRLASYLIDDERLYSDQEIADQLGESIAWVSAVTSMLRRPGHPPAPPEPFTPRPADTPLRPCLPDQQRTNMIYDRAAQTAPKPPQGESISVFVSDRIAPAEPSTQITNMTYDPGPPPSSP